jgi:hypothetical protein
MRVLVVLAILRRVQIMEALKILTTALTNIKVVKVLATRQRVKRTNMKAAKVLTPRQRTRDMKT